jgi:hemoglobin/transferrin/lactoferrin receptor protein
MIRKGIITGLIAWAVVIVHGQEVTVRDVSNKLPLEMVAIQGSKSGQIALTDENGRAALANFSTEDSLVFFLNGYEKLAVTLQQIELKGNVILLNPKGITMDEFVVSASKWEQDKRTVPNKMTTIKAREIAFRNPQTAADMLAGSGDVFVQKSQYGGGSPMIRGFAANRLLMVVDGVRMNNAIFRSGNLHNVLNIDALSVKEAEVIFGPGSVIYGSDALGGVMDFHTITPVLSNTDDLTVTGSATFRFATAAREKTGHAHVSIAKRKWGVLMSITGTDLQDVRAGKNGPDEFLRPHYVESVNGVDSMFVNPDPQLQKGSEFDMYSAMLKAIWIPVEGFKLKYGAHIASTSNIPRYDRLIEYRNDMLRSAEWYYGPQMWIMQRLSAEFEKETRLYTQGRVIAAWQYFEESRHDRRFGSDIKRSRYEMLDAMTLNADFSKNNGKNRFFYGAEFLNNWVNSVASERNLTLQRTGPLSTRYPDDSRYFSAGAYLSYRRILKVDFQHEILPGGQIIKGTRRDVLVFQAGGRYQIMAMKGMIDTSFVPVPNPDITMQNGAPSGSLGLVWNPGQNTQLNFNAGSGFRAPNIDDAGKVFDSEPGNLIIPNTSLKPEYALSLDASATHVFGGLLKLDVGGYYTRLLNAMVRRPATFNELDSLEYDGEISKLYSIQNAAAAWVYGGSVGIELKHESGFAFKTRFNYQVGEEELDDGSIAPLRHAAPWFGISRISYTRKGITAELSADYAGSVSFSSMAPSEKEKPYLYATDSNGNPYSPAWYTLNARVSYANNDGITITAALENFTNQLYRTYSSGISAPGINALISLRVDF